MPKATGASKYCHWSEERNHKVLWQRDGISLVSTLHIFGSPTLNISL